MQETQITQHTQDTATIQHIQETQITQHTQDTATIQQIQETQITQHTQGITTIQHTQRHNNNTAHANTKQQYSTCRRHK